MPFTIPPAKILGNAGHTTDHNSITGTLTTLAGVNVLNSAYAGGADPTGVADSTSAFSAAFTALTGLAAGGRMVIPAGTYKISSTVGGTLPSVVAPYIIACDPGVRINYTGTTGPCLKMHSPSIGTNEFVNYGLGSGITGNPILDGTGASAGTVGLEAGDIQNGYFEVTVQNWAGAASIGVHMVNNTFWTEQSFMRFRVFNCTTGVVFDCVTGTGGTGSFERSHIQIDFLHQLANQNGVLFKNGANNLGGIIEIYGNFDTSASVMTNYVIGLANSGTWQGSLVDVSVESDGGLAHGPQTINSDGTGQIFTCTGSMIFNGTMSATNIGGGYTNNVIQVTGDANIQFFWLGQRLTLANTNISYGVNAAAQIPGTGGTINQGATSYVAVNPAGNITGVILAAASSADGQQVTVVNVSSFTIQFAASGTSHVADGVSDTIPALTARTFYWSTITSLWYRAA